MGAAYVGHDPIRRAIRERQATNCINCGAPRNLSRHDCEYCSTQFYAKPEIFVSRGLSSHDDFMDALRNYKYPAQAVPVPSTFKDGILNHIMVAAEAGARLL